MDLIDKVNDYCDAVLHEAIALARTSTVEPTMKRGICNYCEEELSVTSAVFCDCDCRDDYYRELAIKSKRYVTVVA